MSDKPPSKPSGTLRLKSVEKGVPIINVNTAKKPPAPASTTSTLQSLLPPVSSSQPSRPTTTTTSTTSSQPIARSTAPSTRPPTTSTTSTSSSRPGPTPNIVPRTKKEFTPNLVPRKKVEDKIDSLLPGPITDLLKDSLTPLGTISDQKPKQNRQAGSRFNPRIQKKHGSGPTPIANTPSLPLSQLPDSYLERNNQQRSENKATDKLNEDFVNQLFHEMEIDPMEPNHPTHLPLVDPRKVMKEYSLKDAKLDIEMKKKEIQDKIKNGEMSDGLSLDTLIEDSNSLLTKPRKKAEEQVKPFHNEGIFLNDDHLFFIQLPTTLPSSLMKPKPGPPIPMPGVKPAPPGPPGAKQAPTQPTATPGAAATTETTLNKNSFIPMVYPGDFSNTLKALPSGQLGNLKIYKSGKVILTIGSIEYHVSAGNKLKFLEEIKCITHEGPTCYTLGTPSQHLVASPIINIGPEENK